MRSRALLLLAACAGLLAQQPLFRLEERPSRGKGDKAFPDGAPLSVVDVNSTVRIRIDPAALAAALPASGDPVLALRLRKLAELQERVNESMRRALAFEQKLAARPAAEQARLAGSGWGELGQDYLAVQQGLSEATRRLTAYLQEAHPDTWKAQANALALDERKRPAFLAAEAQALQAALRGGAGGARLELVAQLAEGGFVHVPGYDTLAPGTPYVYPKDRPVFGASFQAGVDAAEALAKAQQEGRLLQEALRLRFGARLDQAAADLARLAAALEAAPDLAPLAAELKALKAAGAGLREDLASLKAVTLNGTPDPAEALRLAVEALGGLGTKLQAVADHGRALADAARAARVELPAELRAAWSQAEASLRVLGSQALADLLGRPASAGVGTLPEAAPVPWSRAQDAELDLIATPRKEGEVLAIRARLLRDGAAAGEPPLAEQVRRLEVRVTGWSVDTGGVLQFVKVAGDTRNAYVAAPGAYVVYRWRGERRAGEAGTGFMGVLAPGAGLATVAVPMQDGSTRLGLMGTMHLFGDVLQVSWGSTTSKERLFSVGIGLQQLFGFGKVTGK